jgi:transcription antitermination factor NusG
MTLALLNEEGPVPVPSPLKRQWFAVYTASNHEKKVKQQLHLRNIETFLPLYAVTRRWGNRTTVKVERPLFNGYVFVRIARTENALVLGIPSVRFIVGDGRRAVPLPDDEIETLRSGLHLRQVDPYPYVKVGARTRIRSGPFAGMEGVVIRKDDQLRVVLSLDLIRKSIAVHINADELEPCEHLLGKQENSPLVRNSMASRRSG